MHFSTSMAEPTRRCLTLMLSACKVGARRAWWLSCRVAAAVDAEDLFLRACRMAFPAAAYIAHLAKSDPKLHSDPVAYQTLLIIFAFRGWVVPQMHQCSTSAWLINYCQMDKVAKILRNFGEYATCSTQVPHLLRSLIKRAIFKSVQPVIKIFKSNRAGLC